MKSLVIISGADRVGKSTLAKRLFQDCLLDNHSKLIHHWGPPENKLNPWVKFTDVLKNPLRAMETLEIWDRSPICVKVYESVYGIREITDAEVLEIENQILEVYDEVTHIYLTRDWKVCSIDHLEEISKGLGYDGDPSNATQRSKMATRKRIHTDYDDVIERHRGISHIPIDVRRQDW